MGFDVYGKSPDTTLNDEGEEVGRYFRANVWWWRRLWTYCEQVAPDLIPDDNSGHHNDGWGLDAPEATQLALRLKRLIAEGHTKRTEEKLRRYMAGLPKVTCDLCAGTGIRTDRVGVKYGMPDKLKDDGTKGWCNGCQGKGEVESFEASYPFEESVVAEFAEFCEHSGGFEIC